MAKGLAESLQFEQVQEFEQLEAQPYLRLVEDPDYHEGSPAVGSFIDADTIPELRFTKLRAAQEAQKILEYNRSLLIDGDFESVPLPVDPLGTARLVVEAKRKFGVDSPQYQELFLGLILDCERLYKESLRVNTWEDFGESNQHRDQVTGNYMANGVPVLDITTRGLSPLAEAEEVSRRINDHVGESLNHAIPRIKALGHLGLHDVVRVRHISECADWAIDAYKKDKKSSHGGYAPAIKKLMVGDIVFDGSDTRTQEQIGVSGKYITHRVIIRALRKIGVLKQDQALTKTELHGERFIGNGDDELIDFITLLDELAGEDSGRNLFMGEEVSEDYEKNYDNVRNEAEERRRKLAPKPTELAEYLINLEEKGTEVGVAVVLVNQHLRKVLFEIAALNPDQAAYIFDESTAAGIKQVSRLADLGQLAQAGQLLTEVWQAAPEISYCGAGSCGLEAVSEMSREAQTAHQLGLRGKLIHDSERSCPGCKTKTVYYDRSGNKACTSCGSNEISGVYRKSNVDQKDKKLFSFKTA